MPTKNKTMDQIQVRIDLKTKKQAKKILAGLGLDISTAVKMLFKQIINSGTLPYEIRDANGFTLKKAKELREARVEAKTSSKKIKSSKELISDALS